MELPPPPKPRSALLIVTLLAISGVTAAGLWTVSYFCVSQPSSPLNLSDWECGSWSAVLVVGILAAGAVLASVTWAVISKRR
jgi:hypothetical protein